MKKNEIDHDNYDLPVKEKKNRKGIFSMIIGLLLLAAALLLVLYNRLDAAIAARDAEAREAELQEAMQAYDPESYLKDEDGKYYLFPPEEREMPTITLEDGYEYIGTLRVPLYSLNLPVIKGWDYDKLRYAPCLYEGSYFDDNMVICGHNYPRHFSNLKWIPIGSAIEFETVEGEVLYYVVENIEVVKDTDIESMIKEENDDWDLTLFTCTTGGRARSAVRCQRQYGGESLENLSDTAE